MGTKWHSKWGRMRTHGVQWDNWTFHGKVVTIDSVAAWEATKILRRLYFEYGELARRLSIWSLEIGRVEKRWRGNYDVTLL